MHSSYRSQLRHKLHLCLLNLDNESINEYLFKNTYMEAYCNKELTTKNHSLLNVLKALQINQLHQNKKIIL